jgi:uncharacterized protein (TIGR00369 family)
MDNSVLLTKLEKFCPDWIQKPDASLDTIGALQYILDQVFAGMLNIKIQHLDKDKITGMVPYEHSTANVVGYMHGGAIFTTGDTLAGAFLWANSDENVYAVTTRSEIKYIRPFTKGILRCSVTEKLREGRKVVLEAKFEDTEKHIISVMEIDYLLMSSSAQNSKK